MSRVLLVEDDKSLGRTLQERLEKESLNVDWARSQSEAQTFFDTNRYDLIVLDVGLPDGSGFELAQWIRTNSTVPFIFVTAQGSAEERLKGYELGAEEYIPKPFHLKEFLLRVGHVLKNHAVNHELLVADIVIEMEAMCIRRSDGRKETLAPKDFSVLKQLIDSSPRVLSRDEILSEVWGEEKFPSNRTVDNSILRLRQTLGAQAGPWIRSVRGIGYQWMQPENLEKEVEE